MTPTDVEAMVQNLNHRVTQIEQILPTLATRQDLERLAALEKRLEGLAAKSDFGALETRLEELAGKTDLEALERRLGEKLAARSELETLGRQLREELAPQSDLESSSEKLRVEMALRFDEAKRYALVLHEDLKSDIGLIAEHLAGVMSRLPPRER